MLATNVFSNTFLIRDGGPGNLPVASQNVTTTIGVPDLIIESVKVPGAIAPNPKFTATLAIRNVGLGRACNPSNPSYCGGFYVDTFVDPATPPPSYPFVDYGDALTTIEMTIAAGQVLTVNVVNISFTPTQKSILYFKVDNYRCLNSCLPVGSKGGLVPEYNENNNVNTEPIIVPRFVVYLPSLRKSQP